MHNLVFHLILNKMKILLILFAYQQMHLWLDVLVNNLCFFDILNDLLEIFFSTSVYQQIQFFFFGIAKGALCLFLFKRMIDCCPVSVDY